MVTANIYLPHGGGLQTPKMIVLHAMAEYIDVDAKTAKQKGIAPGPCHAVRWLDICGLSAHALITPTGVSIRCRKDDQMAWHARGHNHNSLGIEFLVPGKHNYQTFLAAIKKPYLTNEAFHCGQEQIREWLEAWNIDEMKTHQELDPSRKHDPGTGFPLNDFLQEL